MKSWVLLLIAGSLCLGPVADKVFALDNLDQKAQEVSDKLDMKAKETGGIDMIVDRLISEYNVNQGQIETLRSQGLGIGEVNLVLGLAEQMTGGANDQNIKTVLSSKQSQPAQTWGTIAKSLNLDLGPVVKKMEGLERTGLGGSGESEESGSPKLPSR